MPSESRNPFGITDDASVGTVAWTCANGDLDNDDGTECSVALGSGNQSHFLQAIQCGFAIPSGATINGVLVTVLRRVANGSGGMYPAIRDAEVRLAYIGSTYGDDKADTGTDWPTSELQADYGGISDLWGTTLTPAIINHTSFGVMISLSATGGALPDTAFIDRVTIQVTYTVAVVTDPDWSAELLPGRQRQATYRRAAVAEFDLSSPPAAGGQNGAPVDDERPVRRRTRLRRTDAADAALLSFPSFASPAATDPLESPPFLRRRPRRLRRLLSDESFDLTSAHGTCHCEPGAVVVVTDGLAAAVVGVADEAVSLESYAAVVVSEGLGSAEIVSVCDC